MPTKLLIAALLGLGCQWASGQTFEVASIKPNKTGSGSSSWNSRDNYLDMRNVSLKKAIAAAYSVKEEYVNGPSWLESERFDVVAKAAKRVDDRALMQMLQALLVDRFKLAVHKDVKQVSGYSLVTGKGGLKLKESDAASKPHTETGRGRMVAAKISLASLADKLSGILGMPVVDLTGRSGAFDVKLEWAPDERQPIPPLASDGRLRQAADPLAGPSLFTALEEQAGLKLEGRKIPTEIIVVDHVERVPTEN
jgi:uncharacterized protein (TIGR03435 family)